MSACTRRAPRGTSRCWGWARPARCTLARWGASWGCWPSTTPSSRRMQTRYGATAWSGVWPGFAPSTPRWPTGWRPLPRPRRRRSWNRWLCAKAAGWWTRGARLEGWFGGEARGLMEAGADVIVPTGGIPMMLFGAPGAHVDGAPIVNGVTVVLKAAEMAVNLRRLGAAVTSRVAHSGFALPNEKTLDEFLNHG